jgi:hypothetical protein
VLRNPSHQFKIFRSISHKRNNIPTEGMGKYIEKCATGVKRNVFEMWWRKFDKKEECFIFCQVSDNKENAKKETWDHFFLIFFIDTVKKIKNILPFK